MTAQGEKPTDETGQIPDQTESSGQTEPSDRTESSTSEPSPDVEASDAETERETETEILDQVPDEVVEEVESDVPTWDDTYFEEVAKRLMFNYNLSKDERVRGETWSLFGQMRIDSQKQFLHRSINFANHHMEEYLFARRVTSVDRDELRRLVDLAHDLSDEWVDADEEHQGTEFTYILIAPSIPDDVRSYVASFSERTLIKFGYHGHYEVNLVVVAPDEETSVASKNADVERAFALWEDPGAPESTSGGLFSRLVGALRR